MKPKEFKQGVIVKDKDSDKQGVVIDDSFGCCSEDEVPVVWDGVDSFFGTDYNDLEVVGIYEPKFDGDKCGTGQGSNCCIYLGSGAEGWQCLRFSSVRNTILFKRDMVAKRAPKGLFPKCQEELNLEGECD